LHSVLAELDKLSGKLLIDSNLCKNGFAYVSQEPWIEASTIKKNILFGSLYKKNIYDRVIEACALKADLEQLSHGDETLVGEKGLTLSGGQKARIALARACYAAQEKDVFILDDPISAVDNNVAKIIYDKCINGFLNEKTKILVTHHLEYLKSADLVLVIDNSQIIDFGKGSEIISKYNKLAASSTETISENRSLSDKEANDSSDLIRVIEETSSLNELEAQKKEEEEKEHGVISYSVLKYYLKSIGLGMVLLTIFSLAFMQGIFYIRFN
jgi:ABC-type multidrug transport system ATPase subunit